MKNVLIICICFLLSSCAGLAIGTFGTRESTRNNFDISNQKNEFENTALKNILTKEELISAWGEPNQLHQKGKCEVLTYHDGFSWSGVGAFLIIIPIPILIPTGYDENRFYFVKGQSVGLVQEYGKVTGALGYMCGSNECKWYAGSASESKRAADFNWCD